MVSGFLEQIFILLSQPACCTRTGAQILRFVSIHHTETLILSGTLSGRTPSSANKFLISNPSLPITRSPFSIPNQRAFPLGYTHQRESCTRISGGRSSPQRSSQLLPGTPHNRASHSQKRSPGQPAPLLSTFASALSWTSGGPSPFQGYLPSDGSGFAVFVLLPTARCCPCPSGCERACPPRSCGTRLLRACTEPACEDTQKVVFDKTVLTLI